MFFWKKYVLYNLIFVFGVCTILFGQQGGQLDITFSTDGKVVTDFFEYTDRAFSLCLDDNGKIIVVGIADNPPLATFGIARYDSNGYLDSTFGSNGLVSESFGIYMGRGRDVIVNSDKIIVAGTAEVEPYSFGLMKFNGDGSLDTSFGSDGKVTTSFESDISGAISKGNALVLDGNQEIIVVGTLEYNSVGSDIIIAKYDIDGNLDNSFGNNGKLQIDFNNSNDRGNDVIINSNGKILVVGCSDGNFALVRLNNDGTFDNTFGTDGKVVTDFNGLDDEINSVTIDANNNIVVAGYSGDDFALARYDNSGELDLSFGIEGKTITDFNNSSDHAYSISIDSNNNIVVVGASANDFALAKYNSDGIIDPNFGSGGKVTTDFNSESSDLAYSGLIDLNGRILATGVSNSDFALARYISYGNPSSLSKFISNSNSKHKSITLHQNYPNPFNPFTIIKFEIPNMLNRDVYLNLSIYNISGLKVKNLFDGKISPGKYSFRWDGSDNHSVKLPSGIYFYQISTPLYKLSKRMLLLR